MLVVICLLISVESNCLDCGNLINILHLIIVNKSKDIISISRSYLVYSIQQFVVVVNVSVYIYV